MSLQTIRNVELFRIGTHNGEEYSREDLLTMAEAFGKVGYQVPVKVGHGEMDGMPAMGWVSNVRVDGDTLVGDMELQPDVFKQVQARLYDHVSVEIYFNAVRDGVTFPKALKAVALLGAETPGCAGLKPLREATFAAGEFEKVATFQVKVSKMTEASKTPEGSAVALQEMETKVASMAKQLASAETEINALRDEKRKNEVAAKVAACKLPAARKALTVLYTAHVGTTTTVKCMAEEGKDVAEYNAGSMIDEIVGMLNKLAEMMTSEMSKGGDPAKGEDEEDEDPGMLVNKKTIAMMAEKKMDYGAAMKAVLVANPALAKAYASRAN